MSNSIKIIATLGLVAFVAACGQQEEPPVYIDPPTITVDPPMGKYK